VVMFKPLSQAYTTALTTVLERAQGLVSVKKREKSLSFGRPGCPSLRKRLS
jgi:hypothetical protein